MIFTFYSFKGGVGRSMAMAAVAYLLAQRKLKVLVIDFDLEAPGLERYFFDEPSQLTEVRSHPGLIDLVLAYRRALTSKDEFDKADFKDWPSYVVDAIPRTPGGGSVDLMTSGRRHPQECYAEYALAVRSFDWQDFFHNWRGDRFFDWLRRELTGPGHGYDVVLIDSRTGVTEMGGVCAYQLADVAVLLCAANYQNLDGTRAVVSDFRSDSVLALRQGRPLEIVVVPARVEQADPRVAAKRDQFFADFERVFGSDGLPRVLADAGLDYRRLALPYQPELAIIERLVDETALVPGAALASGGAARASFETLADALTLLTNGRGPEQLKRDAFARLTGRAVGEDAEPLADLGRRGAGHDVYLEHCPGDGPAAQGLAEALSANGLSSARSGRAPGARGSREPARAGRELEYAHALVVCVTGAQPGDAYWSLFRQAQSQRKRILPVLLPGCDDPARALGMRGLAGQTPVDLRSGIDPPAVKALLMPALDARGAEAPGAESPAAQTAAPYPGAAPFGEDHAGFFFARDEDVDRLVQAFADHDLVLLSGAAAVGKTSLARAGLLPRVRAAEGPFALREGERPWTVVDIDLARGEAEGAAYPTPGEAPVFYVLDGIDSFPAGGRAEALRERLDRVTALLDAPGGRRRWLLVWRDALPEPERDEALAAWRERGLSAEAQVVLPALPPERLREAIERPAARTGHLFEPGLLDRIVQDAGRLPGAVAQVQRSLEDVWKGRRRGWLINQAYDAGGGLAGRFAQRLEAIVARPEAEPARILVKRLLDFDARLCLEVEAREWSALATMPALAEGDALALRDALLEERLIELWRSADGALMCSLAQPEPGPTLSALAQEDARFLLWRQRFGSHVHDFVQCGRQAGALVAGEVLGEAEHWLESRAAELSADERALIESSRAARGVEAEAERGRELERLETRRIAAERDRANAERERATRKARWLAATAVMLMAALSLAGVLWTRMQTAQHALRLRSSTFVVSAVGLSDPTVAAVALTELLGEPSADDFEANAMYALLDQPLAAARFTHGGPVRHVAFNRDGTRLVTVSEDGTAGFWDDKGRRVAEFRHQGSAVVSAAFRGDGHHIVTADGDGTVRLWDAAGRSTVLEGHLKPLNDVAFSPDGQRLVTAADAARLWDGEGRPLAWLRGHADVVVQAAFSPDGKRIVTASMDNTARLWDAAGRPVAKLEGHTGHVRHAAWSADSRRVVTASDDDTARIWDRSGRLLAELRAHKDDVRYAGFSPNGMQVVTASADGAARIWSVSGKMLLELRAFGGAGIGLAEFSPDGERIITISDDGTARLWDGKGQPQGRFRGHDRRLRHAAFSPDGRYLATASDDGTARLWILDERPQVEVRPGEGPVYRAVFGADGRTLVTVSSQGEIRSWDVNGKFLASRAGHEGIILDAALDSQSGRLVTASADDTALWDAQGGRLAELRGHTDFPWYAAFSPDGKRVITASHDRTARVWDLSGRALAVLTEPTRPVLCAALGPDGRHAVSASDDGTARLWDLESRASLPLSGHRGSVRQVAFSPDGRHVVTASEDGTARVWNEQGKMSAELKGHDDIVFGAAFSPDGRRLVTASADRTARLWDLSGGLVAELRGHRADVEQAAFSPDGERVATVSRDGAVRIWPVGPKAFRERVGRIALPCLTGEERQRILLEKPEDALAQAYACARRHGLPTAP